MGPTYSKIAYICYMQKLIVQPRDKRQLSQVKSALKALGVPFTQEEVEPYDRDFVKKVQSSLAEFEAGKTTKVKSEDLKKFLGL